jgi:arylsulfatase A-like enzyme
MDVPQYLPGYTGELSQHCVTIAEVLKQSGYSTYMTGKWHLTHNYGQWKEGLDTAKYNWPRQSHGLIKKRIKYPRTTFWSASI